MKNIVLFFVFTVISLGVAKRHKPVLSARVPATSLNTSDTACPSNSLIDEEVRKTKTMLGTETLFRPCDCGGPGWEKIAFYDFSQQECPPDFNRTYNLKNVSSCNVKRGVPPIYMCKGHDYYYISSLTLPVEGRSYSNVCGRVRGHGFGAAFYNSIQCNNSLEIPYVSGISLTHGPAGRRSHIWTFAAAYADGYPYKESTCGCSNTRTSWPFTFPDYVGHNYFCDSDTEYTKEDRTSTRDADDDLWDGKGCGPSSSCCELNDPPYFCKRLNYTTSEDLEIRLFSFYYHTTVSLIEIFVK